MNLLRENPPKYANYLEDRLRYYRGKMLHLPGQLPLKTKEGTTAVREVIKALRSLPARPALKKVEGLDKAARDHVRDIGPKGLVQHKGRDGSQPADRVARYARESVVGEVISFGPRQARDVVIDLVVDDGIPDRGHRTILLDPVFREAGAACGPHATYGTMCVIDLATPTREAPKRR